MKKALVLGVLAFFAINVATAQSVKTQDRKVVTTEKKEIKADQKDMEADNRPATLSTEKRSKLSKAAATSIQQDKKKATEKKDVNAEKKIQTAKSKANTAEVDNTKKQVKPNNSVPPKPVVKKEATAKPEPNAEK